MFMLIKTHEAAMAAKDEAEIAAYATDLKRANEARDNWRDSSKENERKYLAAVKDIAAQADEIAALKADCESLRNNRDDWRETAKLYRPGHEANERRLKRDRDQKAAKRAAKAPVKGVE